MDTFDRRALIVFCVAMLAMGGIGLLVLQQRSNEDQAPTARDRVFVADATFTTVTGELISITPRAGEYIVVHSWATWCPPCHQSLPAFDAVADSFQDHPIRFLAINRKEPRQITESFLSQLALSPMVTVLHDVADHVFVETEGYTVPETIVFAPDGTIIHHQRSSFSGGQLTVALEQELSDNQ